MMALLQVEEPKTISGVPCSKSNPWYQTSLSRKKSAKVPWKFLDSKGKAKGPACTTQTSRNLNQIQAHESLKPTYCELPVMALARETLSPCLFVLRPLAIQACPWPLANET